MSQNSIFQLITGVAGSGKTYLIKERIKQNPKYALLTASTGISAINLSEDAITLASALRYFNTESMVNSYKEGWLINWARLALKNYNNIVIEEFPLIGAKQLDIIYSVINELNQEGYKKRGIILVGDFIQLPAIKEKPCFEANCWNEFENNITKLTKVHRQTNPLFLEALNNIRAGNKKEGVELLLKCNVEFVDKLDLKYEGTTIIPKNDQVKSYNIKRLIDLKGDLITVDIIREGKQLSEWTNHIPLRLNLKIGSYIMITNNSKELIYGNGDCGYVEKFEYDNFYIRLVRNNNLVRVGRVIRKNLSEHIPRNFNNNGFKLYTDYLTSRFVIGHVKYHPIRLAYSSTVHRTQGLTLDNIQVDITNDFFKEPSMIYVALSRVKEAEGLRIVGTPNLLMSRINIDEKVRRWV